MHHILDNIKLLFYNLYEPSHEILQFEVSEKQKT